MSPHPTTSVFIGEKYVQVDRDVLPAVCALNAIPGIVTTDSCQGGIPYVAFRCAEDEVVLKIVRALMQAQRGPITFEARTNEGKEAEGVITYVLRAERLEDLVDGCLAACNQMGVWDDR